LPPLHDVYPNGVAANGLDVARARGRRKQPTIRSLMGPNSNPHAGPLLAWLRDGEARCRISRLHRDLGLDKNR